MQAVSGAIDDLRDGSTGRDPKGIVAQTPDDEDIFVIRRGDPPAPIAGLLT